MSIVVLGSDDVPLKSVAVSKAVVVLRPVIDHKTTLARPHWPDQVKLTTAVVPVGLIAATIYVLSRCPEFVPPEIISAETPLIVADERERGVPAVPELHDRPAIEMRSEVAVPELSDPEVYVVRFPVASSLSVKVIVITAETEVFFCQKPVRLLPTPKPPAANVGATRKEKSARTKRA